MFRLQDVLQLKDSEEVLWLTRRHVVTVVPKLVVAFLCIVLPFFFLFPLWSLGAWGIAAFVAIVCLGAGLAIHALWIWDSDVLIVTSLRIVDVDQYGIFSRTVSEVSLSTIQDCTWSQEGFWEKLFQMGSVEVQTGGGHASIEAVRVPVPDQVHEVISDARHAVKPKSGSGSAPAKDYVRSELISGIHALLDRFSAEELRRIEMILKQRERAIATEEFLTEDSSETEKADSDSEKV